ncbi:MAG: PQQ-binding-like beta-propeller repeat protein [Holosporaceae bacterium]|jgi:outer membrane protein assembly factor BamB|nr:PQQ-binding-like beta-propeller repeat protein [Holosporaceae bacterium]
MNRFFVSFFALLFLVSCSSKERIKGVREELVVAEANEDIINGLDTSKVIIDSSVKNREYCQPFLNASHYYSPMRFSTSPLEKWSSKIDFEVTGSLKTTASPVIAEGKVFCIDAAGVVYAFNRKNGERLWRTSTTVVGKDGQIGGAIAYDNGRVIVTSSFSECFLLDSQTGKIIWRIKLPAPCKGDGITIFNKKAFLMCSNSSLQAIDIGCGKILWSHSGMIADSTYIGSSGAAVDNGVIYLAYPSGEVYALLIENGATIWSSVMSKFSLTNASHAFSHPRACPIVKDGVVYVVAASGQTVAFDAKTGKVLWRNDFGSVQTPVVSGNSIFVFNSKSEVACLNKENGKRRWSKKLTLDEDHISDWYGMLLIDDYLAMLSPKGYMTFVSVYDGKIKKTIDINDGDDGISVNPVVADGVMYILLDCGRIVAYR